MIAVGGLLAAGCVALGLLLAVLSMLAAKTGDVGLTAAVGPGWGRTLWHLGVGIGAELIRSLARRRSPGVQVLAALVVVITVSALFSLSWWS